MMQQYAAIYASSMGVMLLFKLIRGVAFVKVRVQPRSPPACCCSCYQPACKILVTVVTASLLLQRGVCGLSSGNPASFL